MPQAAVKLSKEELQESETLHIAMLAGRGHSNSSHSGGQRAHQSLEAESDDDYYPQGGGGLTQEELDDVMRRLEGGRF